MQYSEVKLKVPVERIETAEAVANMVVPYGIYIEDYSDIEELAPQSRSFWSATVPTRSSTSTSPPARARSRRSPTCGSGWRRRGCPSRSRRTR